ncbi:MAG: GNAT family N-acetyltransferase [Alphaproteobacteria bacterium]|nr:GNAT family N-acetyltransferase [Alphaproteobacteria bacterium]
MSATLDRQALLAQAASPRQAGARDAPALAGLLTQAFLADPVFDWIARPGPARIGALEQFFRWLLAERALPFGEVWTADGVVAVWVPPNAPASPGGFWEQMRLLPMFLRLCGLARMGRGSAMGAAMEENHPKAPHFYLAFIGVSPSLQGLGLGSAVLEANLKRIDAQGAPAYLENSNPKNARLYERLGFATQRNIAPTLAPPLTAMWRDKTPPSPCGRL